MDVDKQVVNGNGNGNSSSKSAQKKKSSPKDHDFYTYYSSLQNQANMIGDVSRTGTYRKAILGNAAVAFKNKIVLDVGAGSGILSFLSAQAGATHVVALEASSMAEKIAILVNSANMGLTNPHFKERIRIIRGMVEDEDTQAEVLKSGKVDTIISEPIGVMLFHERMVESYILARDTFLKPGGQLLPSAGHLFFCPFTDEALYLETDLKAQFFNTTLFGTDFRDLYATAREEVFAQPIVGMFPPSSLVAPPCPPRSFDFYTITQPDLEEFRIDIDFVVSRTALIHGLASWFDLDFFPRPSLIPSGAVDEDANLQAWGYSVMPPANQFPWMGTSDFGLNPPATPTPPVRGLEVKLSTGPNAPRTHWQQARLLLPQPLAANKGERVKGSLLFTANDARSYDITLDLSIDRPGPEYNPSPLKRHATFNLSQQCYNYSYTPDASATTVIGG